MFVLLGALVSLVISVIRIILSIVELIAKGKVLDKKNESWWAILIPFYGDYCMYRDTGKRKALNIYIVCSIAFTILVGGLCFWMYSRYGAAEFDQSLLYIMQNLLTYGGLVTISTILAIITYFASFGLQIFLNMRLARCFNQYYIFGIGLQFIPLVFFSVLAFNRSIQFTPSYDF